MSELKPCPFCGNPMNGYPDYTISFKRDRRKTLGIYFEICTLHCNRCTCEIHQAGATREDAETNAANAWNRRADTESIEDSARMRGFEEGYLQGVKDGRNDKRNDK